MTKIILLLFIFSSFTFADLGNRKDVIQLASSVGFGVTGERSHIMETISTMPPFVPISRPCGNGIPYGILLAITCPAAAIPAPPLPRPPRGCTTGIPYGILMGVTCP
jgi:hypothetical protein